LTAGIALAAAAANAAASEFSGVAADTDKEALLADPRPPFFGDPGVVAVWELAAVPSFPGEILASLPGESLVCFRGDIALVNPPIIPLMADDSSLGDEDTLITEPPPCGGVAERASAAAAAAAAAAAEEGEGEEEESAENEAAALAEVEEAGVIPEGGSAATEGIPEGAKQEAEEEAEGEGGEETEAEAALVNAAVRSEAPV